MEAERRAALARQNFESGYNCPQSVVMAFADVLEEHGIPREAAARLASPFGGGMGRMREVCGAVSGMLMVLGVVEGYDDPDTYDGKSELYARVQDLAGRFRQEHGTIYCRELLGLSAGPDDPAPERRSEAYYQARPCAELCATAARLLAEHLNTN